jgi:hypothetical protein
MAAKHAFEINVVLHKVLGNDQVSNSYVRSHATGDASEHYRIHLESIDEGGYRRGGCDLSDPTSNADNVHIEQLRTQELSRANMHDLDILEPSRYPRELLVHRYNNAKAPNTRARR